MFKKFELKDGDNIAIIDRPSNEIINDEKIEKNELINHVITELKNSVENLIDDSLKHDKLYEPMKNLYSIFKNINFNELSNALVNEKPEKNEILNELENSLEKMTDVLSKNDDISEPMKNLNSVISKIIPDGSNNPISGMMRMLYENPNDKIDETLSDLESSFHNDMELKSSTITDTIISK